MTKIDGEELVTGITVTKAELLTGRWSFGIGFEPDVVRSGRVIGRVLYEPYMVVIDGRLHSLDGRAELRVPIRAARPHGRTLL